MSAIVNHLALDIGARSHAYAACVNGRTLRGEVANTP